MSTLSTRNGAPAMITQRGERVVRDFLEALAREDLDAALALLAEDVAYTNVSLPTVHGRAAVERIFRPLIGRAGFNVHVHSIAADGRFVLTDRTDALIFGPCVWQFWVYGRFEVVDGQITVWRDSFDYLDLTVGLVRGVFGVAVPALRRRWPG